MSYNNIQASNTCEGKFTVFQSPGKTRKVKERYCSEKSKDPAPMGTGNSVVVNFTAETNQC